MLVIRFWRLYKRNPLNYSGRNVKSIRWSGWPNRPGVERDPHWHFPTPLSRQKGCATSAVAACHLRRNRVDWSDSKPNPCKSRRPQGEMARNGRLLGELAMEKES